MSQHGFYQDTIVFELNDLCVGSESSFVWTEPMIAKDDVEYQNQAQGGSVVG